MNKESLPEHTRVNSGSGELIREFWTIGTPTYPGKGIEYLQIYDRNEAIEHLTVVRDELSLLVLDVNRQIEALGGEEDPNSVE